MLARGLATLFRAALEAHYRCELAGAGRIPSRGPVLLVANHPNALIDPLLVATATPRPVRFLAKSTLFSMPGIGFALRAIGGIPVYRRMDAARPEPVGASARPDPVEGQGDHMARNAEMFEAAAAALVAGEILCLFPEGQSHSDPRMRQIRTGAARIALLAEGRTGFQLGLVVVPVGITYEAKTRFRSRALVEVGHPIAVAGYREAHASDPMAAARTLTDHLADGLARVVVEGASREDLELVHTAERILAEDAGLSIQRAPLDARWGRLKRIAEELPVARARAPTEVAALARQVATHRARLTRVGLSEDPVVEQYRAGEVLAWLARTAALLLLALPLAAVGWAAFYLPYKLPALLARALRRDEDEIATMRAAMGIFLIPLTYLFWIWLAWYLGAPGAAGWAAAILPVGAAAAIALRDRQGLIVGNAAAFLRLAGRGGLRRRLVARRAALARKMVAMVPAEGEEEA
jgi:1-acyl-sn-glycerol-3-phosphate acyltransferase